MIGQPHSERRTQNRVIALFTDDSRPESQPEPQLTYEANSLWMEWPFAEAYLRLIGGEAREVTDPVSDPVDQVVQAPVKTPVKTPVEMPVKTPEQILAALAASPELTLAALALSIGKSLRAVERATAKLVKDGRVRFVGPRKGGHWEVLK
jgi:ATP-dependent DNA helicase RecG